MVHPQPVAFLEVLRDIGDRFEITDWEASALKQSDCSSPQGVGRTVGSPICKARHDFAEGSAVDKSLISLEESN